MSYIVKNCPSCTKQHECIAIYLRTSVDCKDRNDCVMKQIVELCRKKDYFVKRFPNVEFSSGVLNSELAFDILQLLDIQEV